MREHKKKDSQIAKITMDNNSKALMETLEAEIFEVPRDLNIFRDDIIHLMEMQWLSANCIVAYMSLPQLVATPEAAARTEEAGRALDPGGDPLPYQLPPRDRWPLQHLQVQQRKHEDLDCITTKTITDVSDRINTKFHSSFEIASTTSMQTCCEMSNEEEEPKLHSIPFRHHPNPHLHQNSNSNSKPIKYNKNTSK